RKFIRIIRNTSPLIAHLRCKHPAVFTTESSAGSPKVIREIKDQAETADSSTQTSEDDFESVKLEEDQDFELADVKLEIDEEEKEEKPSKMEYDMNLRLREMMALRLDDAVGDMQNRVTTNPMAQLVRALCESCLWLIRDWPGQKIDNLDSVRASRLDMLGRLRQLLRARPPKYSEMDGLILLLADAMLTISEQWPGGEAESTAAFAAHIQPSHPQRPASSSTTVTSTVAPSSSVHIPPVYGTPGTSCKPPAFKLPRLQANQWTVDGYQQPSTSNSFPPPGQRSMLNIILRPHREMPQAGNAGSPSALWAFFKKEVSSTGALIARCHKCGRAIPRHNHGTSGMKNHMKVYHTAEYATLGMDSSASSETSQSSPPGVPPEAEPSREPAAKKKAPANVSAIIAALNSEAPTLPDMSTSPLFNSDIVKEEEMDYDEDLSQSLNADDDSFDGPSSSSLRDHERAALEAAHVAPPRPTTKGGSDIWSYFTKADGEGGEKHGCCNLCDWSRKIYNHGTNTMWSHLRRTHPYEYSLLKPYEYNPAIHCPPFLTVSGSTVASGSGGNLPSHLTLPRAPEAGGELSKEEEE
ncbi:hypothetical protein PENTCL1PPCAC_8252, partial [Pristionchus entomophagus]